VNTEHKYEFGEMVSQKQDEIDGRYGRRYTFRLYWGWRIPAVPQQEKLRTSQNSGILCG
jgi:hypothetical protein